MTYPRNGKCKSLPLFNLKIEFFHTIREIQHSKQGVEIEQHENGLLLLEYFCSWHFLVINYRHLLQLVLAGHLLQLLRYNIDPLIILASLLRQGLQIMISKNSQQPYIYELRNMIQVYLWLKLQLCIQRNTKAVKETNTAAMHINITKYNIHIRI